MEPIRTSASSARSTTFGSSSGAYINFQGRAREAMEFYHRVLGGKLDLQPAAPGKRITHARLEADGAIMIATDGHPAYPAKVG